ncbi:MAG TPA: cob(I)yrinic acid a,c-diamide adenosyltransferase [Planctomycetota bacterium]|jgi:cob(I)alamin adenosyltransferase|nr:cob(I)yrinic acid a,c-diamide adenosyltransferase [Planctomycetota bacterium]
MSLMPHSGDDGNTSIQGSGRVPKDHDRLEALGALEELNAQLGLCRATAIPVYVDSILDRIQSELVDLGREVLRRRGDDAAPVGPSPFSQENLTFLEADLESVGRRLPPQTEILLPGGNLASCMLQVARALCRKAERRVVPLARIERISGNVLRYLNRLGSLLFALARLVNHENGNAEHVFRPLPDRAPEN